MYYLRYNSGQKRKANFLHFSIYPLPSTRPTPAPAGDRRLSFFNIVPKVHFLAHVAVELHQALERGSSILNPSVWSTQMAEDYVGALCKMSLNVHPANVAKRNLEKYLVRARREWLKESARNEKRLLRDS